MPEIPFRVFNGLNVADNPENLLSRSHQATETGFVQVSGVESPDMENIDLTTNGIRKRKGSVATDDPVSDTVFVADDLIVAGTNWINPVTGTNIKVLVSKKTIYLKEGSGDWKQANLSTGAGNPYTHSSQTVTKATFASVDGHLFIGTNGANNYIQVYKSGDDLDPELVAANLYEYAYGAAGTETITGTWPKAAYLLAVVHNRLCFSTGNTLIEYTPMAYTDSSGVWDLTNGGYYIVTGDIKCLIPFTPQFDNSVNEVLYIGSSNGMEIIPGFASTDAPYIVQGSKTPIGHRTHASCLNWVVYLTQDKNLMGINGRNVIDLGRRAKSIDENGPLDQISISDTELSGFGIYNAEKKQAQFWFDRTSASVENDTCLAVDFSEGEPFIGEQQSSFERRIALLLWRSAGTSSKWFYGAIKNAGTDKTIDGFLQDGNMFTMESGSDDFGTVAIDANWRTPTIEAGSGWILKQWQRWRTLADAETTSDPKLDFNVYLDRNELSSKDFTLNLANPVQRIDGGTAETTSFDTSIDGGTAATASFDYEIDGGAALFIDGDTGIGILNAGVASRKTNLNLRSKIIQIELQNDTLSEKFIINSMSMAYQYGAEIGA